MFRTVTYGVAILMCLSCAKPALRGGATSCRNDHGRDSNTTIRGVSTQPVHSEHRAGEWLYTEPVRFYNANEDLYRAMVARAFASDDFVGSCFNMVSLVEGEPEEMVFAQCATERGGADVLMVTHLVATESIWDKLRTSGIDGIGDIGTRRTEWVLHFDDARMLRELWSQMLARAEVETGTRLRERRHDYFFSAFRPGLFQGQVGGVAKNPPEGSASGALVEIGKLLSRVADSEAGRAENLSLLRIAAKRLLQRIEPSDTREQQPSSDSTPSVQNQPSNQSR